MQSITNILHTNSKQHSRNNKEITRQGDKMLCQSLSYDKQINSYSDTYFILKV